MAYVARGGSLRRYWGIVGPRRRSSESDEHDPEGDEIDPEEEDENNLGG